MQQQGTWLSLFLSKRKNPLQGYLYALKNRAEMRKPLTGIPLCPEKQGGNEETPYRDTFMP